MMIALAIGVAVFVAIVIWVHALMEDTDRSQGNPYDRKDDDK